MRKNELDDFLIKLKQKLEISNIANENDIDTAYNNFIEGLIEFIKMFAPLQNLHPNKIYIQIKSQMLRGLNKS